MVLDGLYENFGIFKQKFNKSAIIRQHRALADLIGGNSSDGYSRENQLLQFFPNHCFSFGYIKREVSKPSIIRQRLKFSNPSIFLPIVAQNFLADKRMRR